VSDPDEDEDDQAYQHELRNLSYLTHLEHRNIVELLCSYTYRGRHNFVFPVADFGDLAKLLKMQDRPKQFSADETFVLALAELSSALNAVHNFTAKVLGLRLTGCHHDLAPRNILVNGSSLLLADFGLSRLKDIAQNSSTSFKETRGHYIAPECQGLDGTFQAHRITRKSDIWSFGCILAEVLTYMTLGADGVRDFERERKYETENYLGHRFHRGPNKPSPGVNFWLEKLAHCVQKPLKRFVSLIKRMLSVSPEERPDSGQVLSMLQHIAVDVRIEPIDDLYQEICQTSADIEATVEHRRFRSWSWAFQTLIRQSFDTETPDLSLSDTEFCFTETMDTLTSKKSEFLEILRGSQDLRQPKYVSLKWRNTV
jgi:serine/threonine protein kinase